MQVADPVFLMIETDDINAWFCDASSERSKALRRDATADENAVRDRHFYVRLSVHCNIDTSDGHLHIKGKF